MHEVNERDPTECAVHGVSKAVSGRELPLRGDEQSQSRDEEEVGDVDVGDGDTAPLHQAEGEGCECRRKGTDGECGLTDVN